MKHCLTILALLLASALCGCSVLPGFAAYPGSPAAKLQTALQRHPDQALSALVVTESNGVLQVGGFVNTFEQKHAVEELINNNAVIGDLGFAGRIVSRVVLYADYDCHASDECPTTNECFGNAMCNAERGCHANEECLW